MSENEEDRYLLAESIFGPSTQGEALYAGTPSLWTRMSKCNLRCPGFPCDTEYSWNPALKDRTLNFTAKEIADNLMSLLVKPNNPEGFLRHPITGNVHHFVFTGGEPLLPKGQRMIIEVINLLKDHPKVNDGIEVTIETNGTQKISPELQETLSSVNTLLSISPKLKSVSGEPNAIDIDNLNSYMENNFCQLKFVDTKVTI